MESGFASTLASAIAAQSLTLDRIAARLRTAGVPASITTLSYWQTGRSVPTRQRSRAVLSELDHILGLDPGTLLNALDSGNQWSPESIIPLWDRATSMANDLGLPMTRIWTKVAAIESMVIDRAGFESRQRITSVMQAEIDGAQDWPIVLRQDTNVVGSVPTVRAHSAMEVAAVRIDPDAHIIVVHGRLPFPVNRGTIVTAALDVYWGPQTERSHRLETTLLTPARSLTLHVDFQGITPAHVRRYWRRDNFSEAEWYDDVVGAGDPWAQSVQFNADAGLHGLSWTW